jgi:hypothetical protein
MWKKLQLLDYLLDKACNGFRATTFIFEKGCRPTLVLSSMNHPKPNIRIARF